MKDAPWKDWQRGPVPFGEVMDRIVTLLGTVKPPALEKIRAAMREADFEVVVSVPHRSVKTPQPVGASVVMTLPTKSDISAGLMPLLMVLGYPDVPPSSITPLAWDRMRAFWEFGDAPKHGRGELAQQPEGRIDAV